MLTWEMLCILSSSLLVGLFSGPWIALSDSFKSLHPKLVIGIVRHMGQSMTPATTVLVPILALSMIPLMIESYSARTFTFGLNAVALALSTLWLLVAVVYEIPLVTEMINWECSSLPYNWEQRRDRWVAVHKTRVFAGFGSLLSLIIAALIFHATSGR